MRSGCPNQKCQFHKKKDFIRKDGTFWRKSDSRTIQRYKCLSCGKRFSSGTNSLAFGQNKRRVNYPLYQELTSGVSMRRAAKKLKIHRTTVKRKLIFLAKKARPKQEKLLQKLSSEKVMHLQFDDLITIEHTKLKPLSVSVAIDVTRRLILGVEVSQIPASGHIAKMSRRKYGFRESFHKVGLENLFLKIKNVIDEKVKIQTDMHKLYLPVVKKHLKFDSFNQYKSERSAVVGQGELKKTKYDPLFMINHTFAMLRENINRLIRKTWCTTKDPAMLKNHIEIYMCYHNKIM